MSKPVHVQRRAVPLFQPRWIALASFLACAPVAPNAFAQSGTLPAVTVVEQADKEDARGAVNGYVAKRNFTATKSDTPLAETAQSISVVTREQMDARAVQQVTDALAYTAGVVVNPYGASQRYNWLGLRGFLGTGNEFLNGLGLQQGVFAVARIDPYSLERVEVLRGPSSVMYGKVGPGGLINLVPKKPTDTPLRELGVTFGSFNKRQVQGDFSDKVNEDGSVRYRLVGQVDDSSSQIGGTRLDRVLLAPSAAIEINRDTDLTVLTNYQRERGDANANGTYSPNMKSLIPALTGGLVTQVNDIPRNLRIGTPGFDAFSRDYQSVGYELEHRPGTDVTLRQNVRYEELEVDYRRTQLASLTISGFVNPQVVILSNPIGVREKVKALVADQQAEFRFGGDGIEHKVLVGLDFAQKRFSEATANGTQVIRFQPTAPSYVAKVPYPSVTSSADHKQRQIGLYVQDRIKIQDRLILSGALRHDWVRSETAGLVATPTSAQSNTNTSGSVGALYLLSNGVSPYASYSTSFNPVLGTDAITRQGFVPETASQFEVGVKYQPPGTNTLFTAAVFDLRQKNTLTRNSLVAGDPATQSGETQINGLELEIASTLFRGFNINGSLTLMDGKTLKHRTAALQGAKPNLVPRQTAGLFAEYTVQSGAAQGVTFGGGVRYVGELISRDQQTPGSGPYLDFQTPGYVVTDLSVRYTTGPWTLSLNANNVFNKEAYASCGNQNCTWNSAREVFFSARYRW